MPIVKDQTSDDDCQDYILEGDQSAWIQVKDLSVWILPCATGIQVHIYPKGRESGPALDIATAPYYKGEEDQKCPK